MIEVAMMLMFRLDFSHAPVKNQSDNDDSVTTMRTLPRTKEWIPHWSACSVDFSLYTNGHAA